MPDQERVHLDAPCTLDQVIDLADSRIPRQIAQFFEQIFALSCEEDFIVFVRKRFPARELPNKGPVSSRQTTRHTMHLARSLVQRQQNRPVPQRSKSAKRAANKETCNVLPEGTDEDARNFWCVLNLVLCKKENKKGNGGSIRKDWPTNEVHLGATTYTCGQFHTA